MNPYNPARAVANSDFFDVRTNEAWLKERKENKKLKPAVSYFRNYWTPKTIYRSKMFVI